MKVYGMATNMSTAIKGDDAANAEAVDDETDEAVLDVLTGRAQREAEKLLEATADAKRKRGLVDALQDQKVSSISDAAETEKAELRFDNQANTDELRINTQGALLAKPGACQMATTNVAGDVEVGKCRLYQKSQETLTQQADFENQKHEADVFSAAEDGLAHEKTLKYDQRQTGQSTSSPHDLSQPPGTTVLSRCPNVRHQIQQPGAYVGVPGEALRRNDELRFSLVGATSGSFAAEPDTLPPNFGGNQQQLLEETSGVPTRSISCSFLVEARAVTEESIDECPPGSPESGCQRS